MRVEATADRTAADVVRSLGGHVVVSRVLCVLAGILVWGSAMGGPAGGEYKPDLAAMTKDLEMLARAEDRITLVLWLPTEFWRVSLESGGRVTPKEVERFTREIDPYVVVAVADGQVGFAGAVTFSEPELVKNAVTIENGRGETFSPLPDEAISAGIRTLMQMMRPVFGNMMGPMGLHTSFIVFPGTTKTGDRTVEPTKEGTLIVHVGTVAVRYRLPLASLLPPVIDEKTGETFPGTYHFNPYTGNKLSPAPVPASSPVSSPAEASPPPVEKPVTPPAQQPSPPT